jgi:hypothetical protein
VDPNEIEQRLNEVGTRPIDATTQVRHRSLISAASGNEPLRLKRRFRPVAVAAAALIGFGVGSAGIAMAGALPNPAQDVAHDVLGVVKVDVPRGKEGKRGPCVSEAAKIEDPDAKKAAKDECPKGPPGDEDHEPTDEPGRSGEAPGRTGDVPHGNQQAKENGNGTDKHDDDPCRGRPPWAGPLSPEEKEVLRDENPRTDCPDDDGDEINHDAKATDAD